MRVLVSWIGHTDLRAMAGDQPESVRKEVLALAKGGSSLGSGPGPVRTLLEAEPFDRVILLSNYPREITDRYITWLGFQAEARFPKLSNPTEYGEIYAAVDAVMKNVTEEVKAVPHQLSILLSPGTPAMAAIWVLLGKTKYPATFYQTYESKAWVTNIPFDLTMDVLPGLLRDADSQLHLLASRSPQEVEGFEQIAGNSSAIRLAVGRARKAAVRDVPVLLTGESGTGKEMFAHAIHASSARREKPFLVVNCAAIPRELIESQLFGHEKGAFTGALKHVGAFQRADGGTLFLDEVGELDPDLQAKLLRVLQPPPGEPTCTREFQPVGSTRVIRANVRVIAATNRDLMALVQGHDFREDLLYRLAVITIRLPSLRERKSDIPKIADALLDQINRDFGSQEPGYKYKSISEGAKAFVVRHEWPGNVRGLNNALLQAAVMSDETEILVEDLQAALAEMPSPTGPEPNPLEVPLGDGFCLESHMESFQSHYLIRAMREAGGVKSKAARLLGMKNYQTLDAQLKRLRIKWERD